MAPYNDGSQVSQKPNPTAIGLFIVVGLGLGAAGLILFSSSRLFTRTREMVLYFNESLNGLNEGAPVKYRGVAIGTVKRVMIRFNQAPDDYAMPVIIEVQENLLRERMGDEAEIFTAPSFEEPVARGLRGSLQAESLFTGVLFIEIHYSRSPPPPVFHQLKTIYPELPTEPTGIQQLLNNLAALDLKGMAEKINSLIAKLNTIVDSVNVGEMTDNVNRVLTSANRVLRSPELRNTIASAHATLEQYRRLGERLDARVDPLADGVTNTLAEATRVLAQLRGVTDDLRSTLRPDGPLRNDLDQLLQQLAATAESVSAFVEFLRQHPNALITGREAPPKKP